MIDILFVLQNAWYDDGVLRPYPVWEKRLWKSHTGRRLKRYIPKGFSYHVINANYKKVGTESSACFEPDLVYLKRKIEELNPRLIVPCGIVAQDAIVDLCEFEFFPMPHPAWRQLTNDFIDEKRNQMRKILTAH